MLTIVPVLLLISTLHAAPIIYDACNSGLRVHLTVSPLVDEAVRQLEVHWTGITPGSGDWVGIFASDPAGVSPLPTSLAVVETGGDCEGWQRTQITEENRVNSSAELGFQPKCLGYYIGYIRGSDSNVLASNCLRLEPTWMSERPALGNFPLSGIFLPGSHDSGAWGEVDPVFIENPVTKYTVTQDEDILSQLIRGVRYLDIRVGYYSNESLSGFWLNHGLVKMHPMEEVTEQVRQFLLNTPATELVIFDVQEFAVGFNTPEDHDRLVRFFESEFQGWIIPRNQTAGWTAPINDLWNIRGRLILSYDESSVVLNYPWLWQSVRHMWGNVNELQGLQDYLAGVMADPPVSRAWSCMAELTPTAYNVITDNLGGLRKMAESVNRNVTSWYVGDWGRTVNAVAVDFFRNTDIVRAAIEWNDKRIERRANSLVSLLW